MNLNTLAALCGHARKHPSEEMYLAIRYECTRAIDFIQSPEYTREVFFGINDDDPFSISGHPGGIAPDS